jgi:FkbM family methyltransferase
VPATITYEEEVARLLDVTSAELSARARELFGRESGKGYPAPLVLCGAGQLGRVTLRGLRRAGADVVTFADNNPNLHGRTIDDCTVMSIEEAVRRHGRSAVFVTTIYTARPLREQLAALGVPVASTRAVFFQHPSVFLPYLSIDLPGSLVEQGEAIVDGVSHFADDASRAEYVAQIAWHTLASTTVPPWTPAAETYFPEGLVCLSDHEVFVDCGAYDGDTLREFVRRTGERFERFIAFEPDPANFEALEAAIASLPTGTRERVVARRVAVHSNREMLRFSPAEGVGSAIAQFGTIEVEADSLDALLKEVEPTFIKMDIEGAEPDALRGAAGTLRTRAPTLAICLYHARRHLWEIPKAIRAANADYRIFLRRHSDECWETVTYAFPSGSAHGIV